MKKNFLSIILFLFFIPSAISHNEHYKNINFLEYELYRNNEPIGFHNYKFERNGENLKVSSIIDFKITKLGIDLYKYYVESTEEYKSDQLIKYYAYTDQNKKIKKTYIDYNEEKDVLVVSGTENQLESPKEYPVGTWWNHEIIQAKAQLSGISGRIIEQTVTFIGKEKITLFDKTYNALHFNFKSSDETLPENKRLNTDVWYEEETNIWLKASFDKTGHWEYRLKSYK